MSKKKNFPKLLQTDCHIGIVGSGLGGLSAALAILQCEKRKSKHKSDDDQADNKTPNSFQGRITIYERDILASDRKEGYGMTLTYNPKGPLAQLGILESIAKRDCPSRSHYLFNERGDVMGYYGNAFHNVGIIDDGNEKTHAVRGAGQRGNLRIPRAELRSILMEKIRDVDEQHIPSRINIAWGKRLVSYCDRPAIEKLSQIYRRKCAGGPQSSDKSRRPVYLQFEDGTTDEVDLLIGADGVNSVVAKQYLSTTIPFKSEQQLPVRNVAPEYLGVFIIIGISNYLHPLIDERGYYTLDGSHRLFIMPYAGSKVEEQPRRTMWQLSYPISDREEANRMSKIDSGQLQQEVLKRCDGWHEPFPDMVRHTPLSTIWGTGLVDRDPDVFIRHRQSLEIHGRIPSHVVLLGDAAHAMSPFKGSGANQALTDGPLLAKMLSLSRMDSAVRSFMTEMARRSVVKVRSSREAAIKLHSKDCWNWMASQDGGTSPIFHGVNQNYVHSLLESLKERSIGASKGSMLDGSIMAVIKEMNVSNKDCSNSDHSAENIQCWQSQALEYASTGSLQQLRELSRTSHTAISKATDANGRSCLHLAALSGHSDVCSWLISEARLDPNLRDDNNKTALDAASNEKVTELIQCWMKRGPSSTRLLTHYVTESGASLAEQDSYRHVEQQLRPIRTIQQLRSLLRTNRCSSNVSNKITRILGFILDKEDEDEQKEHEAVLAQEHGAIVLRNFVQREIDQLALGALALRPLNLQIPCASNLMNLGSTKKKASKKMEEIKSHISIPADSPIIVQTNFGPQLLSQSSSSACKKRKIESFPLSKLRYLNLGEWNYNWGARRYDRIRKAKSFPTSLSRLAGHAYQLAQPQVTVTPLDKTSTIPFDMAICNFYHLQRPSDRLGGHKDDVESDLTSPLITISLGAPGIFLLGGTTRSCEPTAIFLRAGDCMIMSGKSRQYFHGVPTILECEEDHVQTSNENDRKVFPELHILSDGAADLKNDDIPSHKELLFLKAFLTTARMNISIRQI